MALRRSLSKRLFTSTNQKYPSLIIVTKHSLLPPPSVAAPPLLRRDSAATGFFRRFLQHSSTETLSTFLTLPIGENLREKLKSLNVPADHRLRFDGLSCPPPAQEEEGLFSVNVGDAKRVMRFVQLEKVRNSLSEISANTIPYGEFVRICSDVCGNREMGLDSAKALDESGNVIVLGGVVFLRPDQVAKSMENLISQTIAMPNDPRRKELNNLEKLKASIDKKAQSQVRRELYFGLGFLLVQTLGFMRLTFWELSWDVMEPICFFVTSLHFTWAYGFFLRTSNEPTFEGYFHRRFKVKQKKLIKLHNFDVERYEQLCEAFYPNHCNRESKNIVL